MDTITAHEALDMYGNDLTRLIAEREDFASMSEDDLRAHISDYVNYPIAALTGSWFDDGMLWFAIYRQARPLDVFMAWAEEAGWYTFESAVHGAWAILSTGPWGQWSIGRYATRSERTRNDVYVAVVAMAVHYSFSDILSALSEG